MTLVHRLWTGKVPLAEAFWGYAILGGFIVNAAATLLFVWLLTAEAPVILSVLAFLLPIPYNVFILVAVWGSAASYQGPRALADLARVAVLLWTIAASAL